MSVYATCGFCDTLLVRHDVNLDQIGKVAELKPDGSPLRVGTHGVYNGDRFEIAGRIQITYGDGYWNEWYLLYENGKTGWIGEAMGEYFVNFQVKTDGGLPAYAHINLGKTMAFGGDEFAVTGLMTSQVVSFEGELPFIMKQGYDLPAADLRSPSGKAATIDYSEAEPTLFIGEYKTFDELEFKGLADEGGEADDMQPMASGGGVRKFDCSSCGAPLEIKGGVRTQTIVCEYCDSAIDANDPDFGVVWQAQEQRKHRIPPTIPLGSKAAFDDIEYECIGYLRRSVTYDGVVYPWAEYLLYNRFHGYRWMSESDGHFTFMRTMQQLPTDQNGRAVAHATTAPIDFEKRSYKHFQSAQARIDYVAGEFYWRVKLGDVAINHDFISPPYLLSMEQSQTDITWTQGIYMEGKDVFKAFGLEGSPTQPSGIAPNQVNPHAGARTAIWRTFKTVSLVAFAVMILLSFGTKTILTHQDRYPSWEEERSRVSQEFKVTRKSNVQVKINTNLSGRWAYFDMALVNKDTNVARHFGKTVEYYYGDGSRYENVLLTSVPAGTYMLAWTPQTGTAAAAEKDPPTKPNTAVRDLFTYTVSVKQAVPMWGWFWFLLFILIWNPIGATLKYNSFESRRWAESDHAAY